MIDEHTRQMLRNELAFLITRVTNISLNNRMFENAENMMNVQSEINRLLDEYIDTNSALALGMETISIVGSKYQIRIEQWKDEHKNWRVGLDWKDNGDHVFVVEKPTLAECLASIDDFYDKNDNDDIQNEHSQG